MPKLADELGALQVSKRAGVPGLHFVGGVHGLALQVTGIGDDGQVLRIGIYIIFLEAINEGYGVVETMKTVVVVARKL